MKKIFQLQIIFLMLVGCQRIDIDHSTVSDTTEGMVRVPLSFTLPTPSEVTTRSGVELLPDLEKRIARICVAVFEAPSATIGSTDKLLQLVDGDRAIIGGDHAHVLLDEYVGDYHLQAIVNYSDNFDAKLTALKVDLANGTATYGQFTALSDDLTALYVGGNSTAGDIKIANVQNLAGPLPMSSAVISGTNIEQSTNLTLLLTNSYSRITVNASSVPTTTYTILGATLLKGAEVGFYDSLSPLVISNINSGAIKYNETDAADKIPDDLINHVSPIYLFSNNGDGGANPTDIIIRGNYTDIQGNTHMGYHKIRIKHNDISNSLTYDILHNTLYHVMITKVNRAGYETFVEAEMSAPTSDIMYDVVVDDDSSLDIVTGNGSYYLGFSNSDFIVYDDAALTNLVATTFNYALSPGAITDGVVLPTPTVIVTGSGISLTNPAATYSPNSLNDVEINLTSSFTSGDITFRLGNIAHRVNVEKLASQSSTTIILNDFSIDDYIYGVFDDITLSSWISFTNAAGNSSVSSDTGGIPLSLELNTSGLKRVSTPLYLSRKGGKGRVKTIISQN